MAWNNTNLIPWTLKVEKTPTYLGQSTGMTGTTVAQADTS